MECNKDEADMAKERALEKLSTKDFEGAVKLAKKAQTMDPNLVEIQNLVAATKVLCAAAEARIDGEKNWYAILDLEPFSDSDKVKNAFRNLALLLHPDKRKLKDFDDEPFKLIEEAKSVLSDKKKKKDYDSRIMPRATKQKVASQGRSPAPRGSSSFTTDTNPNVRANKGSRCVSPKTAAAKARAAPHGSTGFASSTNNTKPMRPATRAKSGISSSQFFTACDKCNVVNRFSLTYRNIRIKCSGCKEYYIAVPVEMADQPELHPSQQFHNSNEVPAGRNMGSFPTEEQTGFTSQSSFPKQVQQSKEKDKRKRKADTAVREQESVLRRKHSTTDSNPDLKVDNGDGDGHGGSTAIRTGVVHGGAGSKQGGYETERTSISFTGDKCNSTRESEEDEIRTRNMLMEKAKRQLGKNLTASAQDFRKEPMASSFGENQIWAAYGNGDRMPRRYAVIRSVISSEPFKIGMAWLKPLANCSDSPPVTWRKSVFLQTCGDFTVGESEMKESLNSFSHKVECTQGGNESIQIYPKEGDVWALYRDWSRDWDENTPDEVICKYDVVLVTKYDEKKDVVGVTPLVKVVHFKTVFCRDSPPSEIKWIPRNEMFHKFSHQVPTYLFTGKEDVNVLEGYLELDPAATPAELRNKREEVDETITTT